MNDFGLVTSEQAMVILGISRPTFFAWVRNGMLEPVLFPGQRLAVFLFDRRQVTALANARRTPC